MLESSPLSYDIRCQKSWYKWASHFFHMIYLDCLRKPTLEIDLCRQIKPFSRIEYQLSMRTSPISLGKHVLWPFLFPSRCSRGPQMGWWWNLMTLWWDRNTPLIDKWSTIAASRNDFVKRRRRSHLKSLLCRPATLIFASDQNKNRPRWTPTHIGTGRQGKRAEWFILKK